MNKTQSILIVGGLLTLGLFSTMGAPVALVEPEVRLEKRVAGTDIKSDVSLTETTDSKEKGENASRWDQRQKLESEIKDLESFLRNIDLQGEMNSETTAKGRKKQVIDKLNRYAIAMGELADLEALELQEGGEQ